MQQVSVFPCPSEQVFSLVGVDAVIRLVNVMTSILLATYPLVCMSYLGHAVAGGRISLNFERAVEAGFASIVAIIAHLGPKVNIKLI